MPRVRRVIFANVEAHHFFGIVFNDIPHPDITVPVYDVFRKAGSRSLAISSPESSDGSFPCRIACFFGRFRQILARS